MKNTVSHILLNRWILLAFSSQYQFVIWSPRKIVTIWMITSTHLWHAIEICFPNRISHSVWPNGNANRLIDLWNKCIKEQFQNDCILIRWFGVNSICFMYVSTHTRTRIHNCTVVTTYMKCVARKWVVQQRANEKAENGNLSHCD